MNSSIIFMMLGFSVRHTYYIHMCMFMYLACCTLLYIYICTLAIYVCTAKDKGLVRVSPADVARYWRHVAANNSWGSTHPGHGLMPLGLHGDDGQYNEAGDAVTLVTLNFPLERDNDSPLNLKVAVVPYAILLYI